MGFWFSVTPRTDSIEAGMVSVTNSLYISMECPSVWHTADGLEYILRSFLSSHVAFSTRLFAVLRFESVIHEFDP